MPSTLLAPTAKPSDTGGAARAAIRALPYATAVALVLPLFAAELWGGYRLALSDWLLSALAAIEQPLSVRSPGGQWTIGLALLWFVLAYWQRSAPWWQAVLVLLGGVAALLRAGNTWLDGLLLVAPLGAQLAAFRRWPVVLGAAAALGVLVAAVTVWVTRPPALSPAAIDAAQSATRTHTVFADWQWAPELQQRLPDRHVLAAGGLASESEQFWLNYLKIVQDHEQWQAELGALDADLLVLNTEQSGLPDQIRASADWQVLYDRGNVLVAQRSGT